MKENINIRKRNYLTPTAEWVECEEGDLIAVTANAGNTNTDTSTGGGGNQRLAKPDSFFSDDEEDEATKEDNFEYTIPEVF